jgi:hypothetical protein
MRSHNPSAVVAKHILAVVAAFVLFLLPCSDGPSGIFSATSARAQAFSGSGVEASGVSFNRFARPGESTVRVWVVSDTRSGLYEIGEDVSLGELLVLTGTGPGLVSVRERRRTTIRVYRGDRTSRGMIYEATFEEMLENPGRYPTLQNEDAVVVETQVRARFHWRDALTIVSAASSTILLIERFRRL